MAPTTSSTGTTLDLITIGESMWRLSPPGRERLETTRTLEIYLGGAESNLASALARLGKRVAWWSRLPNNPLGRNVANTLRSNGVDVSGVKWVEGRLGTYFVEFGSSPRPTQVIYDRANSAASQMQPNDFDWQVMQHTAWLHLTGITPALSGSCLETVRRAIREARQAGMQVSFDLNYRAKLWSPEQAAPILDELAGQCTLVIGARRDFKTIFNIEGSPDAILPELCERWHGSTVVMTQGSNGSDAYDGHKLSHADAYQIDDPIQIGAGDAFDAGLIFSLMLGKSLQEGLVYGNALAAFKMTMPGDIATVTREELERFLGDQSAGVLR